MKTIQQIDLRPNMQRFSTLDSNRTADNVSIDSPHKITVHNSIADKNSQINKRKFLNYNSGTSNFEYQSNIVQLINQDHQLNIPTESDLMMM
jgi:hypothetical protein